MEFLLYYTQLKILRESEIEIRGNIRNISKFYYVYHYEILQVNLYIVQDRSYRALLGVENASLVESIIQQFMIEWNRSSSLWLQLIYFKTWVRL